MRFSVVAVAVNCAAALTLFPRLGAPGIAIAEATAGWLSTILLFVTLLRRGHLAWEWALMRRTALLIVSAAVMGGALYYLRGVFAASLASGSPLLTKVGALGLLIAVSMTVYFAVAFLIGGADLGMIRRNLKRKAGAEPAPPADI
jgi:putative peptidoglycan lipid II flippase